jgi:HEAT repeat protein
MKTFRLWLTIGACLLLLAAALWMTSAISAMLQGFSGLRSVKDWARNLKSEEWRVRREAVIALGAMGSNEEAVREVAKMLQDPSTGVRANAALALWKMCPASAAAVPELAEALDDHSPHVLIYVALALFSQGPEARPAIPALLRALQDPKNQVPGPGFPYTIRQAVVRVLGVTGDTRKEVVDALIEALQDPEEGMRVVAAEALGRLGPDAARAVPTLRTALLDESEEVRSKAQQALRQIMD